MFNLMLESKPKSGFKTPNIDFIESLKYIKSTVTHQNGDKKTYTSKSYYFIIKHKNINYEDILIELMLSDKYISIFALEKQRIFHSNDIKIGSDVRTNTIGEIGTFAYNFFLYLYAFPEKIREGVPKDYLFKNEGIQGKRFGLETHPSMIDHSSPIPHVRRGHFRELRNERFGENIGKVIWINETFVKGNAKTIEE